MEIEVFTICDYAQDNGGKMTIVGTFDVINASTIPFLHPCFVALRLRFQKSEAGHHKVVMKLSDKDSKELANVAAEFDIGLPRVGDHSTANLPIPMNIKFETDGKFKFELLVDGTFAAWLEFYVAKI